MCGLFGLVAYTGQQVIDVPKARAARDCLTHRGPDQAGEWVKGQVYMGHRRLSIMDLSDAGRQPIVSDDGSVAISVNGEIYNFRSLRMQLKSLGAIFKSGSDSEVVLHGYRYWGIDTLLEKIDGMYALVVIDIRSGQLYLARDRVGIKPLYYCDMGNELTWASELKAIIKFHGEAKLAIETTALYDFLTYRYVPSPKTPYKNVYKLLPAHVLQLDIHAGKMKIRRYWKPPVDNVPINDESAAKQLRGLIADSVSEQMVADVPIGFFLSGGIDSTIVTGQARSLGHEAHTYSIGFGVDGYDETHFAELVAEYYQTQHKTTVIKPHLDMPFTGWLLSIFDEPFGDNSSLPTWYVAQQARVGSVVVLTGDGSDELFGGYTWYQGIGSCWKNMRKLKYVPASLGRLPFSKARTLANLIAATKSDETPLSLYNSRYFTGTSVAAKEKWRRQLGIPDDYDDMWFFRQYWHPEMGEKKAFQYLDYHTFLPEDILTKVDRTSMGCSLEARVPFLSRKIVEFAFGLPESFIYKDRQLKGGLKYAFRNMLPAEILSRPKKGFSLPWRQWQAQLIGSEASLQEVVLEEFMRLSGVIL